MFAIAFEMRPGLDGQSFVENISFHVAGAAQLNAARPDIAEHASAYDEIVGEDIAIDDGLVADRQSARPNVAFDGAIHLDVATGCDAADHDDIGRDDRRRRPSGPG